LDPEEKPDTFLALSIALFNNGCSETVPSTKNPGTTLSSSSANPDVSSKYGNSTFSIP